MMAEMAEMAETAGRQNGGNGTMAKWQGAGMAETAVWQKGQKRKEWQKRDVKNQVSPTTIITEILHTKNKIEPFCHLRL